MLVYPAGSIDCDEATEARARISWVTTIQHAYRDVVSLCVCVFCMCAWLQTDGHKFHESHSAIPSIKVLYMFIPTLLYISIDLI